MKIACLPPSAAIANAAALNGLHIRTTKFFITFLVQLGCRRLCIEIPLEIEKVNVKSILCKGYENWVLSVNLVHNDTRWMWALAFFFSTEWCWSYMFVHDFWNNGSWNNGFHLYIDCNRIFIYIKKCLNMMNDM